MLLFIVLVVLAALTLFFTREDPRMTKLKSKYYSFIETLPEKYTVLKTPFLITGTYGGDVGTNVNKGGEIFICLDGDENDHMHVLLHELTHSTVTEYDHTTRFWENFKELKELAQTRGLYTFVDSKKYCGKEISDS
jgi:hypothetical protein